MTSTDSPSANASVDTTLTPRPLNLSASAVNMTFDRTLSEDFNETKDNEIIVNNIDLRDENLLEYQTTETSDQSIVAEEYSGSGSGEQPIEDFDPIKIENNYLNPGYNDSNKHLKEEEEWKVLDFFKSNDNRSDKDVFEDIYNKSIIELEIIANNTKNAMESPIEITTTPETIPLSNETLPTNSSSVETTPTPKSSRVSFFRAKCETFNQSMCIEWSTDRLLRARLCCLSEVLADDDSGFGCGHFERSKCNRMLPLIKCCLKDFSQLLDNYFQSKKASPRPSRQRIRS